MKWDQKEFRWTLLLGLLSLPLHFVFLTFQGPFSYDEGVYLATAFQLNKGLSLYSDIYHTQWPLLVKGLSWCTSAQFSFYENLYVVRGFVLFHGLLLIFAFSRLLYNLNRRGREHFLGVSLLAFNPQVFFLSHTILGNIPALAWAVLALSFAVESKAWWTWISPFLMAIALNLKLLVAPFFLMLRRLRFLSVCGVCAIGLSFLSGFVLEAASSLQGGALLGSIERTLFAEKLLWFYEGMGIRAWGESGVLRHWIFPLFPLLGLFSFLLLVVQFKAAAINFKSLIQKFEFRAVEFFAWPFLVLALHSTVWRHHFVILVPGTIMMMLAVQNLYASELLKRLFRILAVSQVVFLVGNALYQQKANEAWQVHVGSVVDTLKSSLNKVVIVDHPWLALQAQKEILPALVDASKVRIKTGQLNCENLQSWLRTNADSLVLDSGRFSILNCGSEFEDWMKSLGYVVIYSKDEIKIYQRDGG